MVYAHSAINDYVINGDKILEISNYFGEKTMRTMNIYSGNSPSQGERPQFFCEPSWGLDTLFEHLKFFEPFKREKEEVTGTRDTLKRDSQHSTLQSTDANSDEEVKDHP